MLKPYYGTVVLELSKDGDGNYAGHRTLLKIGLARPTPKGAARPEFPSGHPTPHPLQLGLPHPIAVPD